MIPFKSKITTAEIAAKYKMQSMNVLVEDATFFDQIGRACDLSANDCIISFKMED